MDYCEAVEILEELNGVLKHIPYGSKEWSTTISRMAKLKLFIDDYDKWAEEQAAKWDYMSRHESGAVSV